MDDITDSEPDMDIHGLMDAVANGTLGPSIVEEPSPSENRALGGRREPSPVSSSSSSSSSDDPDPEEQAFKLYLRRKGEDLESAISAAEQCRLACENAQQFAERIEYEVLEAPVNNIPTAYAVERLYRLTTTAMSQAARADKIYDDLGRIYIYSGASHARTLKELGLEAARKEFRNDLAEWNKTNAATERILRIAYRARITLPPQRGLGEAPPRNTNQDDEGDVEGGNKSTVEDGGSEKPLSPPSKIPMKRTFTEEPTSTLDEDGNEVFTMNVIPDLRTVWKRKKPKHEQKQKQKESAEKSKE